MCFESSHRGSADCRKGRVRYGHCVQAEYRAGGALKPPGSSLALFEELGGRGVPSEQLTVREDGAAGRPVFVPR